MFQESCDMICTLGAMDDIRSYLDLKFSESSKDMQDLRHLITNLAQDHPHFNTPQTPPPPKPISVPTLGPANATVEELLDLATPLMEPNLISSSHRSTPPPINRQFSSSSNSSSISANHPTNGDTDSEPDHSAPPIKPTNTQGNPVFKASQEIAPTQLDSPPPQHSMIQWTQIKLKGVCQLMQFIAAALEQHSVSRMVTSLLKPDGNSDG